MSQPVQYQNGSVEFLGRMFATDSRALIPRFETEFLVTKAVAWCTQEDPQRTWSIIDVGTGSGIIAISLALELPLARITAVDTSLSALALARENALRHAVTDRVHFVCGDLLAGCRDRADVIVANLPYLPTARIHILDTSVRDFEPHSALDGGADGLELYRRLFKQIAGCAIRPSFCIFEIDEGQESGVREETAKWLPDARFSVLKDTSGFTRYIVLKFNTQK